MVRTFDFLSKRTKYTFIELVCTSIWELIFTLHFLSSTLPLFYFLVLNVYVFFLSKRQKEKKRVDINKGSMKINSLQFLENHHTGRIVEFFYPKGHHQLMITPTIKFFGSAIDLACI